MAAILRLLRPGLGVVALMVALSLVARQGRAMGLSLGAVNAAAVAFFVLLVAAPLLLYPVAFVRGYRPAARILASLVPALAWWLAEVGFRLRGHSLPEAVYLTFFIPNYIHLQLLALEMVLAEIGCRIAARLRSGAAPRIFSWRVAAAAVAVLVWFFANPVVLFSYYFGFQRGYQRLFLGGQLPQPEGHLGPLAPGEVASGATEPLPSIVVMLSDDHRWDTMSHAGHPFVETPHLDRLAREGVRFENAFVTSSLCSPSRASFLTGLYPHRHGVFNNFTPWDDDNRTFFEYLKAAGYRTAFIGKWHMPGDLPDLRGVDHFVTFTAVGGQGQYFDCPLVVNGKEEPSGKAYIAEELTDRALAWIESNRDEPFVLYLSHKNVHSPFSPAPPEAERYVEAEVEVPGEAHSWVGYTDAQYVHFNLRPLESDVRRYAEAVASMDREVGRLLDALDEAGLAEDTLVVYTSDNGYLWGEHGLIDKRWAYEESIRVPFLLRYPGLVSDGGRSIEELVLNVDLAPTLLDLAGLPMAAHMQGRSLLPLLENPDAQWRDAVYYNYYFEPPFPVPTTHAVRTDRYKYIEHERRGEELFDLRADPGERQSIVEEEGAQAVRDELKELLAQLRASVRVGGAS